MVHLISKATLRKQFVEYELLDIKERKVFHFLFRKSVNFCPYPISPIVVLGMY